MFKCAGVHSYVIRNVCIFTYTPYIRIYPCMTAYSSFLHSCNLYIHAILMFEYITNPTQEHLVIKGKCIATRINLSFFVVIFTPKLSFK